MTYDNHRTVKIFIPDRVVLDNFSDDPADRELARKYIGEAVRLALVNRYLSMRMDSGEYYVRKE